MSLAPLTVIVAAISGGWYWPKNGSGYNSSDGYGYGFGFGFNGDGYSYGYGDDKGE